MTREAQVVALVEAARHGDAEAKRAAVQALVQMMGGEIMAYLTRRTRCGATAEDLTQRTFLKVLLHIDRLQHTERLRYWVLTIARHQLLDHVRKMSRITQVPVDESLTDTAQQGPEQALLEQEQIAQANAVTQTLTERQRQVIQLAAEGHSNTEIAHALGIRPGTVGALKFKALERARAELAELEQGGVKG